MLMTLNGDNNTTTTLKIVNKVHPAIKRTNKKKEKTNNMLLYSLYFDILYHSSAFDKLKRQTIFIGKKVKRYFYFLFVRHIPSMSCAQLTLSSVYLFPTQNKQNNHFNFDQSNFRLTFSLVYFYGNYILIVVHNTFLYTHNKAAFIRLFLLFFYL